MKAKSHGMPIWIELMVLMLVAYAAGLAIGWGIWASGAVENDTNG